MLLLLEIFLFASFSGIVRSAGFSYEEPSTWGQLYPNCNGNNQSPVDIPVGDGDYVTVQPEELHWNNYENIPNDMRIINNGHSIQIHPTWSEDEDVPFLTGGPLQGQYVVEQFHFHWGQNDTVGSEHTFKGNRTAMEFHMVHWKREYGSFEAAARQPDGLAVIGALYDPITAKSSSGIEEVWGQLEKLRSQDASMKMAPFPLSEFEVVNSGDTFASYYGSLTTPGCNEVVTWLVALDLFSITSDELEQIRLVRLNYGDVDNYRPVQNLNGRTFTYYRSN